LRFQRCHAQLVMRSQSPSGEASWSTRDEQVSGLLDVPWPQETWVCRVSTVSSPKLRQPPARKVGFSTFEQCSNQRCCDFGKEHHNTEWATDFDTDVLSLPQLCKVCHDPRLITKLRFKQCHMQCVVQVQSTLQWTGKDEDCPGEVDIPLTEEILAVKVSTSILPKIEIPVPDSGSRWRWPTWS
jgi:hypothetical protein